MKKIFLNILRSPIVDSVKSQTYLKGLIDKSINENAHSLAYQESAGDECFHERLIEGYLVSSAESISTQIGDYLSNEFNITGDNSVILDYSDNSCIKYTLLVSDRFNESYTTSLARLVSQYIEHETLSKWWMPINEKQGSIYENMLKKDLLDILRCFNKVAPKAPIYPYTEEIRIGNVEILIPKGTEKRDFKDFSSEITYEIDEDSIDDIEISRSKGVFKAEKVEEGKILIIPICLGVGSFFVWSKHKEAETKKEVIVRIDEQV